MHIVGWFVVLSLVVACGGESDVGASTASATATMPGGSPSTALMPSEALGAGAGSATGGCTSGTDVACSCVDGAAGTQACQLDGTLSACQCSAAPFAPANDPVAIGGAGAAAPPPPPGGAAPAAVEPVPAAQEPVLVPAEDLAGCTGVGQPPPAEEEVFPLEIRISDAVPGGFQSAATSQYSCFWVELDMPEKHHIVGWEGAIEDRAIHHQQVSLNKPPAYLAAQGQGGLCGLPSVEYTWTGQGPPEWTPPIAGYPIGGPENGGKAHFLIQTHFEGAIKYTGGFNAYVTKSLRKYDAGNFEQGDVQGILIPAMQKATHVAKCTGDMTTKKLIHPIYVFSSMLHAHLTVERLFAQHFRNGELINTFGDESSAFGFVDQRFKPHTPCIEVLPGDEIITTCEYNNPFPFEVKGGEATNQEMCTVFMQYFPRLAEPSANFCGTIDSTGGFMP